MEYSIFQNFQYFGCFSSFFNIQWNIPYSKIFNISHVLLCFCNIRNQYSKKHIYLPSKIKFLNIPGIFYIALISIFYLCMVFSWNIPFLTFSYSMELSMEYSVEYSMKYSNLNSYLTTGTLPNMS